MPDLINGLRGDGDFFRFLIRTFYVEQIDNDSGRILKGKGLVFFNFLVQPISTAKTNWGAAQVVPVLGSVLREGAKCQH